MSAAVSDWLQTYTGRAFSFPPTPDMIDPLDIAHSLSMQCRYNGHTTKFYSVAEHCCHITKWLLHTTGDRTLALAGLLHDAGEAYLCDVPKPIKPMLAGYSEASDALDGVIERRFGLVRGALAHPLVKEADYRILADEQAALMGPAPRPWTHHPAGPLGVEVGGWAPESARMGWLACLDFLTDSAAIVEVR